MFSKNRKNVQNASGCAIIRLETNQRRHTDELADRAVELGFLSEGGEIVLEAAAEDEDWTEETEKEAVRTLAKLLKIPLSRAAAFGDDTGDIGMLKACGLGIAVADAAREVKAAADFVCGACPEDGVAKWVENAFRKGIL